MIHREFNRSSEVQSLTDLRDEKRLLVLLRQAQRRGDVGFSESERLKFFAAAEHALAWGTQNPGGLLATVIRRGLWNHLSLRDEDLARQSMERVRIDLATPPALRTPLLAVGEGEDPEEIRAMIAKLLELPERPR